MDKWKNAVQFFKNKASEKDCESYNSAQSAKAYIHFPFSTELNSFLRHPCLGVAVMLL